MRLVRRSAGEFLYRNQEKRTVRIFAANAVNIIDKQYGKPVLVINTRHEKKTCQKFNISKRMDIDNMFIVSSCADFRCCMANFRYFKTTFKQVRLYLIVDNSLQLLRIVPFPKHIQGLSGAFYELMHHVFNFFLP